LCRQRQQLSPAAAARGRGSAWRREPHRSPASGPGFGVPRDARNLDWGPDVGPTEPCLVLIGGPDSNLRSSLPKCPTESTAADKKPVGMRDGGASAPIPRGEKPPVGRVADATQRGHRPVGIADEPQRSERASLDRGPYCHPSPHSKMVAAYGWRRASDVHWMAPRAAFSPPPGGPGCSSRDHRGMIGPEVPLGRPHSGGSPSSPAEVRASSANARSRSQWDEPRHLAAADMEQSRPFVCEFATSSAFAVRQPFHAAP
jgi:hypothetical protein